MYPPPIENLTRLFTKFPTIGPRTAARFSFYCLNASQTDIDQLIDALKEVKKSVRNCKLCLRSIVNSDSLCAICNDSKRNHDTLCLVEKETDLLAIENTREYDGIYFILGGTISPLKKEDFKNIRTKELQDRLVNYKNFNLPKPKEVIIATNTNVDGEATAIYLARVLKELEIKTTRLGRGLPTGGELEYADEETLSFALKGRK